jgi:hypothetical protein
MIKSVFKTLSLSFITLAATAATTSAGQGAILGLGAVPKDSTHVACATRADVDRGWEDQQRLVEKRLAEKAAEGLAFPGAIVVPPFESFAPYRKDVPKVAAARKNQKTAARALEEAAPRH